eukprot:TRINITY_DN780084_c0_g1_i1.p1 TRINITY_DN780084_c0_g1~~TRINITY_DN780084_c0_g1_i1.p1  ORF type:complete len:233 (+),score=10.15 TRINITY_DN780084_c0_g1_i1:121-819(+)
MNIFRFFGDISHLASFVFLFYKLHSTKSAAGISLKSLELFFLVFATRYLDVFANFFMLFTHPSFMLVWNLCFKIMFLSATTYLVHQIRTKTCYKATYDEHQDSFLHLKFAVAPCIIVALIFNGAHLFEDGLFSWFMEVLWTFSLYLEAIAILPQLIILQRFREVENLTTNYIFCLGSYRGLYILNWIYKLMTLKHYSAWIVWITGIIQTALYADFFYYFFKSKGKMILPADN